MRKMYKLLGYSTKRNLRPKAPYNQPNFDNTFHDHPQLQL